MLRKLRRFGKIERAYKGKISSEIPSHIQVYANRCSRMDAYLGHRTLGRRDIMKNKITSLPPILAVDFDGTLVEDKYPDIGEPNLVLFRDLKIIQKAGYRIILWTCRTDKSLEQAIEFCASQGLIFDAINKNIPEVIETFGGDARKIYADAYIDDKNMKVWGKRRL
jgi:hypothetical protein